MHIRLSRITIYLCACILLVHKQGQAHGSMSQSDMEKKFHKAITLLNSFKNDSARSILCELLEQLNNQKASSSPFALKVKLRHAEALEKDNKDEQALEKFNTLLEESRVLRQWEVLSNTHLFLARLHEKMSRHKACRTNLNLASVIIKEHKLDKVYPRYAIRNASYHRIFGKEDSAIFFAKEVLRTAPRLGLVEDIAVGHLLLGLLTDTQSFSLAFSHLKKAGNIWKKIEDFSGYQAVMINLTQLSLKQGNTLQALKFNDSALVAAQLANEHGSGEKYRYFVPFKNRAEIFSKLGNRDSALYYMRKGYELELEDLRLSNHQKIIEIDARYNYQKKAQELREKEQLLSHEKERQNWLIRLCLFASCCFAIITYYYLSLRKANKKTHEQAKEIEETNRELSISLEHQIALQEEVHHRVKNNLQVIIALLELQSDDIDDPIVQERINDMSSRIYSMAAIHDLLYQKEGVKQIKFKDYVKNLCAHFHRLSRNGQGVNFFLDLGEHDFNLPTLMPLGIILNELMTNSLKYGRIEGQQLDISIEIQQRESEYCLLYEDNGPGLPEGKLVEREGGLGSYLLKSMSRQLQGEFLSKSENGAKFEVVFKEINKS